MKKLIAAFTSLTLIFSVVTGNAYAGYEKTSEHAVKIDSFSEPVIAGHAGKITEGVFFPGRQVVINIQDLHCNPEVQKNIAETLKDIDKKYGIGSVYAEGAYSDVSTGWICDIENEEAKRDILDALLGSGRLTGSEYYSAISDKPDLIKGIEDQKVHQENIIRLGNILNAQGNYKEEIKKLDKELLILQAKYFNHGNKGFEKLLNDYRSGKTDAVKYYASVIKYVNQINSVTDENNSIFYISFSDYPNLLKHIEVLKTAVNLNYSRISSQMVSFIQEMKEKMPYSVYADLSKKTNAFSNLYDMYIYVPQIVREYDIQFGKGYSELQQFFEYTKKERELNPAALLHEEKLLIEKIRIGLSENINELEVSFISDLYSCFKDYLSASITPEDLKYFEQKKSEFEKIWNKYVYGSALNNLKQDLSGLNEYYSVNFQRDNIFKDKLNITANNIWDAGVNIFSLPKEKVKEVLAGSDIIVVITGGFHSEGLKDQLQADKISYITFMPNISSNFDSNSVYNGLVKVQSEKYASQALALALGSTDAKITFEGNTAFVDFNGEKLELVINAATGKYEILDTFNNARKLKTSIFTGEIKKQIILNIERIRTLSSPLESAKLIYAIVDEASKAGIERGIISGNGLIWAIAGNEDLINAIKENKKDIALSEIAMLPDLMQMYTAGSAISEMKGKFIDNPILKALIDIPEFGEFIKNLSADDTKLPKIKKYNPDMEIMSELHRRVSASGSAGLLGKIPFVKQVSERVKSSPVQRIYDVLSKAIKGMFIITMALMMFACDPDRGFDGTETPVYEASPDHLENVLNDPHTAQMLEYYGFSRESVMQYPHIAYSMYLQERLGYDAVNELLGIDAVFPADEDYYKAYLEYQKLPANVKKGLEPGRNDAKNFVNVMRVANAQLRAEAAAELAAAPFEEYESDSGKTETGARTSKTAAKESVMSGNTESVITTVHIDSVHIADDPAFANQEKMAYRAIFLQDISEYMQQRAEGESRELVLVFNINSVQEKFTAIIDFNTPGSAVRDNIIRQELSPGMHNIRIKLSSLKGLNVNGRLPLRLSFENADGQILDSDNFNAADIKMSADIIDGREVLSANKAALAVVNSRVTSRSTEDGNHILDIDMPLDFNTAGTDIISRDLILGLTMNDVYKDASAVIEIKGEKEEFDGVSNVLELPLEEAKDQRFAVGWEALKTFNQNGKVKVKVNIKLSKEDADKEAWFGSPKAEIRTYESMDKREPETKNSAAGLLIAPFLLGMVSDVRRKIQGGWKSFKSYIEKSNLKSFFDTSRDVIVFPFIEESMFRWMPLAFAAATGFNPVLVLTMSGALFIYAHFNMGFSPYLSSSIEAHDSPVSNRKELADLAVSTIIFSLLAMVPSLGLFANFTVPVFSVIVSFPLFSFLAHSLTNFFILSNVYDIYRKPIIKFSAFRNPFTSQRSKISKLLTGFNNSSSYKKTPSETPFYEARNVSEVLASIEELSREGFNTYEITADGLINGMLSEKLNHFDAVKELLKELKDGQAELLRKTAEKNGVTLAFHAYSYTMNISSDKAVEPYPGYDIRMKEFFNDQLEIAKILGIKAMTVHLVDVLDNEKNIAEYVLLVKEAAKNGITINFENSFKTAEKDLSDWQELYTHLLQRGYIEKQGFINNLNLIRERLTEKESRYLGVTFDTSKALNSYTSSLEKGAFHVAVKRELEKLTLQNVVDYYEVLENAGFKINNIHIAQFSNLPEKAIHKQGKPANVFYNKAALENMDNNNFDMIEFLRYLRDKNYQGALNQETDDGRIGPAKQKEKSGFSFPDMSWIAELPVISYLISKKKAGKKTNVNYQDAGSAAGLSGIISKYGVVNSDADGNAYTNIYFSGMPENPQDMGFKNMGWRVDGEDVWIADDVNIGSYLVIFSKAAPVKVINEFDKILFGSGKVKGSSSILKRMNSVSSGTENEIDFNNLTPGIIIDHNGKQNPGRYNENGTLVVSADILGETPGEIETNLSYVAETRKVDANAMAKETFIYIDGTDIDTFKSYLGAFAAMGNNQMMADFEVFKGLTDKQIIEILSLAKANGISVSVHVDNEMLKARSKDYFRELGFSACITSIGDKMYLNDYFSPSSVELSLVSDYKSEAELVSMIRRSGKFTVVKMSELENFLTNGTRSVVDKISVLETFKTAILKLRSGKVMTAEYARNAGYSWDIAKLPELPSDMSGLTEAVKNYDVAGIMKELGLDSRNNAVSLYISQMADNVGDNEKLKEINAEFLISIIEKALAQKALKENGINDGLANPEFEIVLGQKLLRQLTGNTASFGVPMEVRSFIDREEGTFNDLNKMIVQESAKAGPQAINATIELILLSEQKTGKIRMVKTMSFDAKAVDALLRAA